MLTKDFPQGFKMVAVIYESAIFQFVDAIRESWFFPAIENAGRNTIMILQGHFQGRDPIARIMGLVDFVNPFLVPLVCVHVIKRDTRLKDVDEGKSTVTNAGLYQVAQLVSVT